MIFLKRKILVIAAIVILVAASAILFFTHDSKKQETKFQPKSETVKTDSKDDKAKLKTIDSSQPSQTSSESKSEKPTPTPAPTPTPVKPTFPESKMVPGKRTLKNFLATALAPTGKVLWVVGGGWNYDDTGADDAVRSIGMSQKWLDFFNSEDADYDLYDTWPVEGKNVFHEQGLDTTSYVGWSIYNTLFDKNLVNDGFVYLPDKLVESLSDYCDFESAQDLSSKTPSEIAASLAPGDFAIMPGQHVYIVVGSCKDGSLLISHMAMGTSTTGAPGGSVQLNAVSEGGVECEASKLADSYMEKYPEWTKRYSTMIKDINLYMNFYDYAVDPEANGVLHWKKNILSDPEGYFKKSANEILIDLYK